MSSSTHPLAPVTSFENAPPTERTLTATNAVARPTSVPWYVWCGVLAITSATIGGAWDVSWHRTIGRDTFWTPAHMAIYACGVLAAIICGWLVVQCTFGPTGDQNARLRAASVQVLG